MTLINFEKRKNKNEWDEIDPKAAARGAAILINNGSPDFGKINYSFTADKDVKEFEKQASVHEEFFRKLNSSPEMCKAVNKLDALLDELPEPELDELERDEDI